MTADKETINGLDFTICVANRHVLIHSIYPGIYDLCKPYLAEENAIPDIEIRIDEELIQEEIERSRLTNRLVIDLKGVEWLLLHRMLSEELLSFDTILMHGAVIAFDNAAYMFTANSGVGKTTHIKKWLEKIDGAFVVNGDKPYIIVRNNSESPLACGSPWAGKEHMQTNAVVPLKAIILLERADENHIEPISFSQAFTTLFQQVYRPNDRSKMHQTLVLMERLSKTVSFWRFQCNNFKDNCFEVAYNALINDTGGRAAINSKNR